MKRVVVAALACSMFAVPVFAGLDKQHFLYKGGTLSVPKEAEGDIDTTSPKEIAFPYTESDEKARQTGRFAIPYASVTTLEFGEKSEHRVALAILVSPLALFAKRHLSFLTIGYKDGDGTEQVAVLQLGKEIVKSTLSILEARTGKK